jgi:hypothetical protein
MSPGIRTKTSFECEMNLLDARLNRGAPRAQKRSLLNIWMTIEEQRDDRPDRRSN